MKAFSFRLESVLNYRKFLEKKAMMQLMGEKKLYAEVETSISHFKSKKSEVAKLCHLAGSKGVNASQYQTYKSYLEKLRDDIEKATIELKEKEKDIKEQEMVLKSETVKKKALETLRNRHFEEHISMAEKAEQKYMDEVVILQRGAKT
jgi:flagellar export protein FliJ